MASFAPIRRKIFSLREMGDLFARASTTGIPEALRAEVDTLGEKIAERAKSYLGVPQASGHGGYPPWPPLAPSTLERKGENTPLVEEGTLRDDIRHAMKSDHEVEIGTDVPYGRYLELGTSRMPPRPFLRPAAIEVVGESREEIGAAAVRGIVGGRR